MELFVFFAQGSGGVFGKDLGGGVPLGEQLFDIFGGHVGAGVFDGEHFQGDAHLVVIGEFADVEVADKAALLGHDGEVAFGFQFLQGFAHGGAADIKAPGELVFGYPGSGI